jgi:hypothetical protein
MLLELILGLSLIVYRLFGLDFRVYLPLDYSRSSFAWGLRFCCSNCLGFYGYLEAERFYSRNGKFDKWQL